MPAKSLFAILLLSSLAANAQPSWTAARLRDTDYHHNVGTAQLSAVQRDRLRVALNNSLDDCVSDDRTLSKSELLNSFRLERVRLSANATGYVIQGMGSCNCGATGNCSFWLFDSEMRLLLRGEAQTFAAISHQTRGMNDLVLSLHNSAADSDRSLFQFDGKRYVRRACADVDYAPNLVRIQKTPTITPHKCSDAF